METQGKKRRSLLFWIGLGMILLGTICPVFAFLVPLLGLSAASAAALIGLLVVGIPEILTVLGALLAGKEIVILVHNQTRRLLQPLGLTRPVGPTRYYLGVALILLGLVWSLVLDCLFLMEAVPADTEIRLYLLVSVDCPVLVGFFLAGRPFWEKLKRLVVWTPAEPMPPDDSGACPESPATPPAPDP